MLTPGHSSENGQNLLARLPVCTSFRGVEYDPQTAHRGVCGSAVDSIRVADPEPDAASRNKLDLQLVCVLGEVWCGVLASSALLADGVRELRTAPWSIVARNHLRGPAIAKAACIDPA